MKKLFGHIHLSPFLGEEWRMVFIQYIIFFFSPILWLTIGAGIMVIFDWITGIAAAKKKGEKIVSGGFYRTYIKYLMYGIGIISTRLMELLLNDKIPFASLLAGFIIVIEYKSIMENISSVIGTDLIELLKEKITKIKINGKNK